MNATGPRSVRRVALYARLSVSTDESVSIERQLEAGRQYAASRGWTVVLEAVDDGVSATKNTPEDRVGWRTILDSSETFEAVIVWKVDRLARKTLDFLHADQMLQSRGAGLVAVEQTIDMTSDEGRGFATVLAVFGEMEAAAISARVRAARRTLVAEGRRVGGRPPFGWMNVPSPRGPGMVLAQDPERIHVVEDLVRRALAGESLYSLARSLEERGIQPRARDNRKTGTHWHEASVETILRAPAVAGMTPYTPNRKPGDKPKQVDVLRGADGLPVIDDNLALLTPEERRTLLATLDAAKRPGTRQKAGAEPALLYGLVRCGSCKGLMYRATAAQKYRQYRCQQRGCPRPVGIARDALEKHVIARFLEEKGHELAVNRRRVEHGPDERRLAEIEAEIRDTLELLTADEADMAALTERLSAQKRARSEARAKPHTESVIQVLPRKIRTEWSNASTIEEQRQVLLRELEAVHVGVGGGRGRTFDPGRVEFKWREQSPAEEAQARLMEKTLIQLGLGPPQTRPSRARRHSGPGER